MLDWVGVATVLVVSAIVVALSFLVTLKTIPAGQEGIVTFEGIYRKTLAPGRHLVSPHRITQVVPAGSARRFHVGETGEVVTTIPGGTLRGRIRVGTVELPALARKPVALGTTVRVSYIRPPDAVGVTLVQHQ